MKHAATIDLQLPKNCLEADQFLAAFFLEPHLEDGKTAVIHTSWVNRVISLALIISNYRSRFVFHL
jgi:hypothetical protein